MAPVDTATRPAPMTDRYGPGTPFSTHQWASDHFWGDSCSFCAVCDTVSFKDEAHQECPGRVLNWNNMPRAVLISPKENV